MIWIVRIDVNSSMVRIHNRVLANPRFYMWANNLDSYCSGDPGVQANPTGRTKICDFFIGSRLDGYTKNLFR